MATKFDNPKYATAARLLGRRSGAPVERLTKGPAEYGVKTDRQVRMLIDRMRYGHEAKIQNVGLGRFKLG